MPLTEKGTKIKGAMQREYGKGKGERVFYASANAGKIRGVHQDSAAPLATAPSAAAAPLTHKRTAFGSTSMNGAWRGRTL